MREPGTLLINTIKDPAFGDATTLEFWPQCEDIDAYSPDTPWIEVFSEGDLLIVVGDIGVGLVVFDPNSSRLLKLKNRGLYGWECASS